MDYEMEELLPVVSKLAQKYAGWESTSITYERAQILMEAVLYCLEEYQNQPSDAPVCGKLSVEEQYAIGAALVLEKTGRIREIFNELSGSFQDYGVKCLRDTVRRGIPEFLKWYDAKFRPQETLITLDYPVLVDLGSRRGADAVYHYLRAVSAEQRFLGQFDCSYVRAVLEKYDPLYGDIYENICEILFLNAVGHVVLCKPFQEVGFDKAEYAKLAERFQAQSSADTMDLLLRIIEETVQNDADLLEYLRCNVRDMTVRIEGAVHADRLDSVFLL